MSIVIETTIGDLTVDLFIQERPKACLNFLKLCKLKYYNYNLFHTIEHGFIAQTGDPTGAQSGGESVWGVIEGAHKRYFEAESLPKIRHTETGLLSMVSTGDNMIGSQFFFTLGSDLTSLDGIHCVIGEIVEGQDVLRVLNETICDEGHRPYQDIRITHTVILEDPFEDPRGFRQPSRSPSPQPFRFQGGRIGADEDIDDTEGKTGAEIHEMLQDREAKARATILEIVGDLPDADIAPPENVLFVCKLNPVTTDDDLEIIFSRFGKIKGCEVIRDKVSGDSLQYAFVEFEEKKSCEDAFFKMDNVLIDDRRIHVDFSQSVSKMQWRGKGRGIIYKDKTDSNGRMDFSNKKRGPNDQFNNNRQRSPRRMERQRSPRRDQKNYENNRNVDRRRSRSPYERNNRRNDSRNEDYRQRLRNQNYESSRSIRRSRSRSPYNRNNKSSNLNSRKQSVSPKRDHKPDSRSSNKSSRRPRSISPQNTKSSSDKKSKKKNRESSSESENKKKSKKQKKKKSKKSKKQSSSSSSDSDSSSDSSPDERKKSSKHKKRR